MTTTCFGLYWPSSGCLRGSKDLTIGMHAHVVFDYIQFSKFHTHNGDDTLPRLMVFGRGGGGEVSAASLYLIQQS